jgi:hypothetical protein
LDQLYVRLAAATDPKQKLRLRRTIRDLEDNLQAQDEGSWAEVRYTDREFARSEPLDDWSRPDEFGDSTDPYDDWR